MKNSFINFLFEKGVIDKDQLSKAQLMKEKKSKKDANILIKLGYLSNKEVIRHLYDYSRK